MATIVLGFGLIHLRGGFDRLESPLATNIGMASAMLMLAASLLLVQPVQRQIMNAIGAGGDLETARSLGWRLVLAIRVEQLFWLTALAAMSVPF